jgi:hypothetical protein
MLGFEAYDAHDVIGNVSQRYQPTINDRQAGVTLRNIWLQLHQQNNNTNTASNNLCRANRGRSMCYTELLAGGALKQVRRGDLWSRCATLGMYGLTQPIWWWAN